MDALTVVEDANTTSAGPVHDDLVIAGTTLHAGNTSQDETGHATGAESWAVAAGSTRPHAFRTLTICPNGIGSALGTVSGVGACYAVRWAIDAESNTRVED